MFSRDEQRPDRGDLAESFIGTSYAETIAALMAMRALMPDETGAELR